MAYSDIKDPSAFFHTQIWTGNSGYTVNVTNNANSGNFQPDLIWAKDRPNAYNHDLVDSSRGPTVAFHPNTTAAEYTRTQATYDFTSFDSNGFTTGAPDFTNSFGGNNNTNGKVAWQWKANGGTTASNSDGSKTATVQANQDAGFSIVTYAGSGSASTVGHGLADTPDVIIFKNRDDTNVWATYHQSLGNNKKIVLNTNAAEDADGAFMNGTLPTSSVFSVGASVNTNGSGDDYVAYCFAEKQGYSKFGKYVGNGSQNGPMVYTGFKPAFLIMKRTDSTGAWHLFDNKRSGYNYANDVLQADAADAELSGQTYQFVDFLSNGFKVRRATHGPNVSGATYIYMAFAENPFVAGGIPTTAR